MGKTYEELYPAEIIEKLAMGGMIVPSKEEMTCMNCQDNQEYEFAWDLYNTDGDCIASK